MFLHLGFHEFLHVNPTVSQNSFQVGTHESYFQKNPVLGRPLNQTGGKKQVFQQPSTAP